MHFGTRVNILRVREREGENRGGVEWGEESKTCNRDSTRFILDLKNFIRIAQ